VCYYQLLFDFRQGVRENFMKAQEVRVRIKVKNHWPKLNMQSGVEEMFA